MIKVVATILLTGGYLFASSAEGGATDIVPRTVNFLIFAAIIYYLVADHVKNFFQNRAASIAAKLEEVQAKLKKAKEDKERAEAELEKSKELAKEIIETTKKEIEILVKEVKEQAQNELAVLEKSFEENMELTKRKRIREITKEVLEELFEDKSLELDKEKFVNLIVKKVA